MIQDLQNRVWVIYDRRRRRRRRRRFGSSAEARCSVSINKWEKKRTDCALCVQGVGWMGGGMKKLAHVQIPTAWLAVTSARSLPLILLWYSVTYCTALHCRDGSKRERPLVSLVRSTLVPKDDFLSRLCSKIKRITNVYKKKKKKKWRGEGEEVGSFMKLPLRWGRATAMD